MSNNKTNIYDIDWKNTDKAIKTLKQIIQSEEKKKIILNPYQNLTIITKYKNYNTYDSTYSYSHKTLSNHTQQNSDFMPKVNLNNYVPQYQKYIGKSYILQQYPCQPHTSTQFVNYVKAGEKGNEILGGLVKNGPYKGQFLFTESKNFTGTVIIPEYIKTNNANITTVYPEESITFLNGKIQDIHQAKPSRLKIHRAHFKEERNNSFQRDKAIIHTFIVNDAKSHNQEIFFSDNPNKQISSTKLSPKYIISPDRQLIQSIEEQQKTFIDKIPIINKLFKSYYNNRISKAFSSEKLAISFTESPEKFHIALYAQNRNGKPMKIDLHNLYIYNNNFYNKIEQAVHSSSRHISINTNQQTNYLNQNMVGNNSP
ncbi:hypothetical protein NOVO_06650 [Rickettsiales bacterium Ac37b]|nr:hypothetical protein NOVO_06650 [Rickettsiales bacterium Ac37b]